MPKNWKRKGKSGKGKVRIDLFYTHPNCLTALLRKSGIKTVLLSSYLQISLTNQSDRHCKTQDG